MNSATDQYNWINEIPETWKLVKLKYLARIATGSFDTQDKLENGIYPFFVRSQKIEKIDKYTHDGEAVMTAGDGVGVGKVFHYYNGKFAAHQRLYVFNNFKKVVFGKYIYYSVLSNLKFEVLQGNAKSTVDSLRYPMLANFPIVLPGYDNQIKVVNFLDQKTHEIDDLIADKEKLIKLLEEKRQAVITEAVTKGLDSNVKMKDSGVEWIGEIPEHWNALKLKRIAKRIDVGIAEAAAHAYRDKGVPIVRSKNIKNGKIINKDIFYIDEYFAEKNKSKYIWQGDLITVRTGDAGVTGVVSQELDRCQCFTMLITTLNKNNNPKFHSYYLNSIGGKSYFNITAWGTAQKNISVPILENCIVPYTDKEEQNRIIEYLDQITEDIDHSMKIVKIQINKLKEYRQSLIHEAVTGKIDIRGTMDETEQEEVSSS
ncbi:type I restriction endonuclease subunit S [Virgibacillus phasianinus]|uniref:Type I restriction endonuclease subunit S n=1 Tax=Virgibacillus phasianinus TaxID=2017483 RepID=A0A220U015_9BACI|nr:restriction endonuclease subunit S [Virgibacillus phasianinus]ASK61345.1 type I restriction endonuclease subunit S [Virgibacillus phasianinus]